MADRWNCRLLLRVAAALVLCAGWFAGKTTKCPAAEAVPEFRVQFSRQIRAEPYTGRVYIFFSKTRREPRTGPSWFQPESFVAQDVENWPPDQPLAFSPSDRRLLCYPRALAELRLDGHLAQAVVRFNPDEREIGTGAGNGYSPAAACPAAPAEPVLLTVDRIVPPQTFAETKWSKLLEVRSRLLSDFHRSAEAEPESSLGRNSVPAIRWLRAAVLLPASYYDQPERRYPTIFTIPGFGGTHLEGQRDRPVPEENEGGVEFLRVLLDPSCPLGHHVFADSENNGPVGTALVEEFLPEFDRRFRSIAAPTARFLTGHSSGGWSSLWLQISYPEVFGGVWSTAPDPVDFRDFQRINLYRPGENMYVDEAGQERPIARRGHTPVLWYRGFAEMERVLGPGGQLHSFEAVFSPRGPDGRPQGLWDRKSGRIDTRVARAWEKYDIRLVLERNWAELGPKLRGKLHVHMGDLDTFYLEGATQLLQQSLRKLGSDAVVEMHTGKDHGTLLTPQLVARIRREMTAAFRAHHAVAGTQAPLR